MAATIAQSTNRYMWAMVFAFVAGVLGTLYFVQPHLCDVEVKQNGTTVCHGRGPWHVPG